MSSERKKIRCPECGSSKIWKDGIRYTKQGEIQRYICRSCGFRFSESSLDRKVKLNIGRQILEKSDSGKNFSKPNIMPVDFSLKPSFEDLSFQRSEDIGSHGKSKVTIPEKKINIFPLSNHGRQICVSLAGAKNLAEVKTRSEKRAAGATKPYEENVKGKIVEFLWWMKKQGYKETTIRSKCSRLKRLVRLGANLLDPESVKEVLAMQDWSDSGKETTAYAYDLFAKWMGIKWEMPRYKALRKLPFIPHEREIDDLIAGCNRYIATFLQVIKETGARAGEVFSLKWIDVDFKGKTARITPEKGSNPRIFKISNKLVGMLEALPRKSERVFSNHSSLRNLSTTFERNRKRIAYRLGNPRILKISFHTLRHWKATMEYHRTKDILYVMQMLGHRNIKNTLVYTQLIQSEGEDEYVCRVAKTVEQATELVEAGFDYVCDFNGVKLFRKRK